MYNSKYGLLDKPIVIHTDITSTMALVKNPNYYARTKHTIHQAADGFTKPLAATAFRRFVD
ncbi:Reverse transcriptase RNA-dependent DNA polymerase [Penicillium samsonianum]|uniref:Reverse transcriptase RNA-dependent DNA polymerase n=1 Tax=Penicillium samsonianum TaxID=1882272 RepID=UPI0025480ADD|nr:Reverse transcriptase RNA-dependent DNA polymerase [Penicillium samsonianum]KAJ6139469.1 Reverse transcriptase RNA-dependent DNA polymerase [Penicillium samsonianum]